MTTPIESYKEANSVPYLVRSSPAAMVRLALGSACTIATLLCIPDGVAILPKSPGIIVWLIRIAGLWLSCYFLWTFGFLTILFMVRAVSLGIEFNQEGFRLWRFGKLVPWESVRAISCEPQPFFAKAFCIPPVHRLTIYSAKRGRDGTYDETKLSPHNIPSFQFCREEFESMVVYVTNACFAVVPSSADLAVFNQQARELLKVNYERGRQMRTVMSVIILVGLVAMLGRRAVVNYSFNMGLREYKAERYEKAAEYYRTATAFDPTFAPAWDALARSEYRSYHEKEAEKHWLKALQMKPDYVESKIGLANLHALRREYGEARQLLKKAIQLSPTNLAAYMSFADLQIREFQYTAAIDILKEVVRHDESNGRARGLLARAYLRSGNLDEARRQLSIHDHFQQNAFSDEAFLQLVSAEVAIACGELNLAQNKLNRLNVPFKGHDLPDDLLLDWISLRTAQEDEAGMKVLVAAALKRGIPDDEIDGAKRIAMQGSKDHRD